MDKLKKSYRLVEVSGKLITPSREYWLRFSHPMPKEEWMTDNQQKWRAIPNTPTYDDGSGHALYPHPVFIVAPIQNSLVEFRDYDPILVWDGGYMNISNDGAVEFDGDNADDD